ncbi:MAG: AraC family transcriptional regulator [Treponema sp.]|jgi:AraC-like DNA-binding protein|nr:AraC family transcriptional regulator [Treponema sp.]
MNITEVFSSYEEIAKSFHSVRITERTRERMTIRYDPQNGFGTMRIYALFPGIILGFNDFFLDSFPSYSGETAEGLKINFCVEGRCEAKMSDEKYLFMEPGDLSIDTRMVKEQFTFPNDRFCGIELFVHDSAIKQAPPPLFKDAGIDMGYIRKRFCPDNQSFIAKSSDKIKSIFMKINEPIPGCEVNYFRLQAAELLFLLIHMEKPAENEHRTFFTTGQINIVKQVVKIITSDLSVHYSIDNLARKFSVGSTSLKNYFQGVYGKSISAYLRDKRMDKAAEYLEKSSRPIADIALLMGYENASKFSAAFKLARGESPLEYRRKCKVSG